MQLKDKFYLPEREGLKGLSVLYDTHEVDLSLGGILPAGEYHIANDIKDECGVTAIHYNYNKGSKYLYLNIKKDGALSTRDILYLIDRVLITEDIDLPSTTELKLKWK